MAGLQRASDLYWRVIKNREGIIIKYEVRCYLCVFGSGPLRPDLSPYHERACDAYVRGVGVTEEAALRMIEREFNDFEKGLWV